MTIATILVAAWAAALLPAAAQAAPPNDDFADAQVVNSLPYDVAATNVDATAEAGEPNNGFNVPPENSVWYRWTAGAAATMVVDTCEAGGSDHDLRIAVFTGATLNSLVKVTGENECLRRFNAVQNETYSIVVDSSTEDEGSFRFRLRQLAPPPNDDFANAQVLGPALPVTVPATTVDATWESGESGSLGGSVSSRSIWFRWLADRTGQVRIDVCEFERVFGASNRRTIVYTGATLATLSVVVSSDTCTVAFDATSGTEYRIAFSTYINGAEGNLTFKLIDATPPTNDAFATPEDLGSALHVAAPGNNDFATVEPPDEGGHGGSPSSWRSLWYTWTAPQTGTFRINACVDEFTAHLGVYTGATLATLVSALASPGYSPYCHNNLAATQGTTYRIAVAGHVNAPYGGPFTLRIDPLSPPANDDFADALDLGSALPLSRLATNAHASAEVDEPTHLGFNNAIASVWFRWTAPISGRITTDVCDADFPLVVAVYTGAAVGALTRVDAEEDREPCSEDDFVRGRTSFQATAGQSYWIAVDSYDPGREGDFQLTVFDPNAQPPPDAPIGDEPAPIAMPQASAGFNLGAALRRCRKIDKRVKRARCIRRARLRAARARCGKIQRRGPRRRCIRKARRRISLGFCRAAYRKGTGKRIRCVRRVRRR